MDPSEQEDVTLKSLQHYQAMVLFFITHTPVCHQRSITYSLCLISISLLLSEMSSKSEPDQPRGTAATSVFYDSDAAGCFH